MLTESYQSLSEAHRALREHGFTDRYELTEEGLKNLTIDTIYRADQLKIVGVYRFEGMSNPSDESVLYAVKSEDGRQGTVVSSYGAYGNEALLSFLEGVERDLPQA